MKKTTPQLIRIITLLGIVIFFSIFLFNKENESFEIEKNKQLNSPDFRELQEQYTKEIHYLSSDDMKGRKTGSPEMQEIAKYTQKIFEEHGIQSIDNSYTQEVPIPSLKTVCNNIMGFLKGTDEALSQEVIVLSAHYDHLGIAKKPIKGDNIYNGARDNAVGVSAVIQSAIHFSKYPVKRSLLFVLFTGEELGFFGSKYMATHLPINKESIVFMLNTDGAGYNDKSIANIVGLKHTNMSSLITEKVNSIGLGVLGDPTKLHLFERSDNISFVSIGIPAVTMSVGFRSFDDEIEKNYHTVTDESDTLDFEYLTLWLRAYITSATTLANTSTKPDWVDPSFYLKYSKSKR